MERHTFFKKKSDKLLTYAIAGGNDPVMRDTVKLALEQKLGRFLVFGSGDLDYALPDVEVFQTQSDEESVLEAVRAIRLGQADVLVKGFVPTATILHAVLAKENELRTGKLLSQVALFEMPSYPKPLIVTDCAMNIAPNLEEKTQITRNAIEAARAIGIEKPNVVFLSAVEKVTDKMLSTVHAKQLMDFMAETYPDLNAAGPLALDAAISKEAARHKGITNPAAGQADILVVPNIETGNVLYKALVYFGSAKVGSCIVGGAKVPIVISSRSDTKENKLRSFLLTGRMV
ncbi:phosphate acyltransferase [Listeria fleischmannii]|uniref:Phosphate acetyltransferase n=1 Tax=Listeria fleischmannii subsp. fleischmannii TaxID=1671902 RepID=A0A2X3J4V2_9LIST|nr:phosphate acyltransferase [Listeria fleischmannii]EMG27573.1 putative phosphotransbutyrylase [Listeria fleischmannii subsp. fleischmannii LU2006-1]SQC69160.1 Phosphate acetyltransferase [Listeria fleischmannii subsp. fleischmannii]